MSGFAFTNDDNSMETGVITQISHHGSISKNNPPEPKPSLQTDLVFFSALDLKVQTKES